MAEWTLDDVEFVERLKRRDESAFRELLDRYDPMLRRIARRFVQSEAAVDEAVSDTWIGVIRGIDRFEGRSSFRTWLVRVLSNTAIDRGVRESRQIPTDFADEHAGFSADMFAPADDPEWPGHWRSSVTDWSTAPSERLDANELFDQLRVALDGLPERQRCVYVLRDVEGWSSSEVAHALDLTEVNQRVLLHRARGRVRAHIDSYLTSERA